MVIPLKNSVKVEKLPEPEGNGFDNKRSAGFNPS